MNSAQQIKIGFIGFGEVASCFSEALVRNGAEVYAFDSKVLNEGGVELLQARSRVHGIEFCDLPRLVSSVDIILSTVTSASAVGAARSCLPYLDKRHTYVDLNSTSPAIKREISEIVMPTGASFLEGAILGAVRVFGAQTRVLLGGRTVHAFTALLQQYGIGAEALSEDIGRASSLKFLRSTFSKSCEAILLETLMAAELAGLRDEVWSEIVLTFAGRGFQAVAEAWITTHPDAHRRRLREIGEVVEQIREYGLTPIMTDSAYRFFERSEGISFVATPRSVAGVVRSMARQLKTRTPG
jgi:3-hydroxyisobutyrate dehydrogenase-like beta-hydroxyacid dehydrogenase